jgi:hypothetical protein
VPDPPDPLDPLDPQALQTLDPRSLRDRDWRPPYSLNSMWVQLLLITMLVPVQGQGWGWGRRQGQGQPCRLSSTHCPRTHCCYPSTCLLLMWVWVSVRVQAREQWLSEKLDSASAPAAAQVWAQRSGWERPSPAALV